MALGWIAPIVLAGVCLLSLLWTLISAPGFRVRGLHVLLTVGSDGLGLAIAKKYAKAGAKLTLVGPSMERLKAARTEILSVAGDDAAVFVFECELTDEERMKQAVEEAGVVHERPADHLVYAMRAPTTPGYLWEQDLSLLRQAMDVNYHGAVVLLKTAMPAMIEAKVRGRIVFVSDVDSLAFPVGAGGFSGTKSALRGLADSLRNELQLYNISVSIFYPGKSTFNLMEQPSAVKPTEHVTANTPGAAEDHPTADYATFPDPNSTKKSDKEARTLVNGLWAGQYSITTTWDGFVLRMLSSGVAPRSNTWLELIIFFFVAMYKATVTAMKESSLRTPKAGGTAAFV